jgi:hypothetical protein
MYYRDIVLYACVHNTTYDAQCEGTREVYLYQAISFVGDKDFFEKAILAAYAKKNIESYLFDQLNGLLVCFATDGSVGARTALYEKYDALFQIVEHIKWRKFWCQETESLRWLSSWLILLDGKKAIKMIAERIGAKLLEGKSSEFFWDDFFYFRTEEKLGKKGRDVFFKKQAARSEAVSAFYNKMLADEERSNREIQEVKSGQGPRFTLEKFLENVARIRNGEKDGGHYSARRFARRASAEELKEVARLAREETDPACKAALLSVFEYAKAPFSEEEILAWYRDGNEELQEAVLLVLAKNPFKKTHDFIVSLLRNGMRCNCCAVIILSKIFQKGDEDLLFDTVKRIRVTPNGTKDEENWHCAFTDVEEMFRHGRHKSAVGILPYLYRENLCSCCRISIVRTMDKYKILTKDLIEEMLYDSHEDTRRFAERKLKKREAANK